MEPKEMFKLMLKEDFGPLFKGRGYKKKGTVFCKELEEVVQIINFIPSRWNIQGMINFSIDYAVFSKPYFVVLNRNEPRSWFCYQNYRPIIGGSYTQLKNTGSKYTPDYEIVSNTDISALEKVIKQDLEQYVFSYIDRLTNTYGLIEEIERQVLETNGFTIPPVMESDLIPLYYIVGQRGKAQEKLNHIWEKARDRPKYRLVLSDIAQKLNLKVDS